MNEKTMNYMYDKLVYWHDQIKFFLKRRAVDACMSSCLHSHILCVGSSPEKLFLLFSVFSPFTKVF